MGGGSGRAVVGMRLMWLMGTRADVDEETRGEGSSQHIYTSTWWLVAAAPQNRQAVHRVDAPIHPLLSDPAPHTAHMAMAISVLCVGSSPSPVVTARTLKGLSSPLMLRTTNSCTWELCSGWQGEGRAAGEVRVLTHAGWGGGYEPASGWMDLPPAQTCETDATRACPGTNMSLARPAPSLTHLPHSRQHTAGSARPSPATPGPGGRAPQWRPPTAPGRWWGRGTAPGSCAGSRCLQRGRMGGWAGGWSNGRQQEDRQLVVRARDTSSRRHSSSTPAARRDTPRAHHRPQSIALPSAAQRWPAAHPSGWAAPRRRGGSGTSPPPPGPGPPSAAPPPPGSPPPAPRWCLRMGRWVAGARGREG